MLVSVFADNIYIASAFDTDTAGFGIRPAIVTYILVLMPFFLAMFIYTT